MDNLLKCRTSVDPKSMIGDNIFNSGLMLMATGIYTGLVFRYTVLHPIYHSDCFKQEPLLAPKVIAYKLVFIGICCLPWYLLGKPFMTEKESLHPVFVMLLGCGLPSYITGFLTFSGCMQFFYLKLFG